MPSPFEKAGDQWSLLASLWSAFFNNNKHTGQIYGLKIFFDSKIIVLKSKKCLVIWWKSNVFESLVVSALAILPQGFPSFLFSVLSQMFHITFMIRRAFCNRPILCMPLTHPRSFRKKIHVLKRTHSEKQQTNYCITYPLKSTFLYWKSGMEEERVNLQAASQVADDLSPPSHWGSVSCLCRVYECVWEMERA